MRKKTALQTPKQRKTSLRQQGGLIVRGKSLQPSATAKFIVLPLDQEA